MMPPLLPTAVAPAPGTDLVSLAPPLLAGAAAVYLLLPRPRPYPAWWGTGLAALALVLGGILVVRAEALTVEVLLFYVFAAVAVVSGGLLVTQHNPARGALSFALVILSTCGLFLLLAAPFLMAATIIIYGGAIIVTFLFVLMLAQQSGLSSADVRSREPFLATLTGFVLLAALLHVLGLSYGVGPATREIDELLIRTRRARAARSADEIRDAVGPNDQLVRDYLQALNAPGLQHLRDRLENEDFNFTSAGSEAMKESLGKLEDVGVEARRQSRQQLAWLMPHGNSSLSNLSGPPSNLPPEEFRRDEDGRPQLPAENSGYLGRSLFTDYLLPVELGGTLLLVATVGAIAIAQRRPAREGGA